MDSLKNTDNNTLKSNPVIILAGGFGTRLKNILNGLPKPLANINGKPFLFFLLKNLVEEGFNDFVFSLHYKSELIIEIVKSFQSNILMNCKIQFVVEQTPMGTGGAISYINTILEMEDNFIVVNADTWIESGYGLINNSNEDVIAILKVEDTSRYGTVLFDSNFNIKQFIEKKENQGEGYINAGIYKLNKKYFSNWNGQPYSIEASLFPDLVKQSKLKAMILNTSFIDIGVPVDYNKFCTLNARGLIL